MLRISALVLAGGESRRMGHDKALLSLSADQPMSLLAHISQIASVCTDRTYILTPWPQRYRHLLDADSGIIWLAESPQRLGPLVALSQGWSMVLAHGQQQGEPPPDWLLVLACDLPALDRATIQTWCQELHGVGAAAIAALPHSQNRWEPLCGFYHRRCIPHLNQAVQQNIHSFQTWLANETVATLRIEDEKTLQNCNTPAQWHQFLDQQDARKPGTA